MKKVMVIAGGRWQIDIIKKAKSMGLYVINTNLYKDSPAFSFADACEVEDILNKEGNLEIAKKYSPDAIITDQCDIAISTVAYLNEQLNLRGIGTEIAKRFTNKYEMRKYCDFINIPNPDFCICYKLDDAMEFLEHHNKIVIKPVDNQSSRGVYTITDSNQLKELFSKSLNYSTYNKAVIAEEYIDGVEFTVDGIKTEYGHMSLIVSEKKHYEAYSNVASQLYFTNKNVNFDYDKLKRQNDKLVEEMKLPFGLTHAEYKYSRGEFYLIEIAARGGGSNISSRIVQCMTGIDSNRLLINMALNQPIQRNDLTVDSNLESRCCVMEFFNFDHGIVKKINGEDELKNNKNIIDYVLNVGIGDEVGDPSDDSKRPGFYIAYGDSQSDLDCVRNNINSKVFIEYE